MTKVICDVRNETRDLARQISFEVTDRFGRVIGANIYTSTIEFVASGKQSGWWLIEPGKYFAFCPQASRDCRNYGAQRGDQYFKTLAEREAAIIKYLAAARKRAVKNAGK